MYVCGMGVLAMGVQQVRADLAPPVALEAASVTETGFTARWSEVPGVTAYVLDVYHYDGVPPTAVYEGFDGYPANIPAGWEIQNTKSDAAYASAGNFGANQPSVKLQATGHSVTTVAYPAAVTRFSFWCKGVSASGSSSLPVSASNETGWVVLDSIALANEPGATHSYAFSTDDAYTRFKLGYTKDKGNVAIDDVALGYGDGTRVYVLTNAAVGAVTSYPMSGLVSGVYRYVVRAVSGTEVSADSNEIEVDTRMPAAPPWIAPFEQQTARVGETFECPVVIQATNGDPVIATNVTATTSVSGAWSLNAEIFSYTPDAADIGEQRFTFTAEDKDGECEGRELVVTVRPALVPAVVMADASGIYTQTFDALANTTVWDNAAEPLHAWYAYVDTAPVTSLRSGTGSGTASGLYAFSFEGSNTCSLGSLAGGGHDYVYGMALINASGNAITECVIQGRTRQWRVGANAQTNTLLAEYCVTNRVIPLNEGVWHRLNAFCFDSPLVTNELFQKGGAVTNDVSADGYVRLPRPIPPDGVLLLRWVDVDDSGNDHAFGIDYLSVSWTAGDVPVGIRVPLGGVIETFDEMGDHAAGCLPWGWRVESRGDGARVTGPYAEAGTTVTYVNSKPDFTVAGSYNFSSGGLRDQAVGGLTDDKQAQSISVLACYVNDTGRSARTWDVAFDVEKYRRGTVASAVRLLCSADGVTWSEVGAPTAFDADADITGFPLEQSPGETRHVERQAVFGTPVAPGGVFYLAWQFAVAEGEAAAGAQAQAIDDVSVSPVATRASLFIVQ
ncbi:MAG TPA: hypothetical protein P5026_10110 [Kiritimatiellia bacterium]|nr:hypothetical protein [Kiritimatiellia bacterium]HRU71305.1 hypothetical protein [Kiritimatiellia bacterium]